MITNQDIEKYEIMIAKVRAVTDKMSDEELLAYLDENDPEAKHDDLTKPDSEMAEYWRAAGDRGLL